MQERALLRTGAILAIVSAVLGVIVNALHPRTSDTTSEAFVRLAANTDSAFWVGDHLGILVAALLGVGGLLALSRSIRTEPSAGLARLGLAGALVSAGIWSVLAAIDGIADKLSADAWASAPAAEKAAAFRVAEAVGQLSLGIFTVAIIVFFGATFIAYGLAVAFSQEYPRSLGWVGTLLGVASALTGFVQAYQGPSVLVTNTLFPIFSIALTAWLFFIGLLLWRRASAAT